MKRLVTLLVVLAVVAVSVFGYFYLRQQRSAQSLSDLQTQVASRGSLTATVGATGVVHSNQSAVLTWGTSGTVQQVAAELTSSVVKDDILASLAPGSLSQAVILAQADLVSAQKALDDLQKSETSQVQAQLDVSNAQQALIDAQRARDEFDKKDYKDRLQKAEDDVVSTKDKLDQAQEDFDPYKDWDPDNDKRKSLQEKLDDAQLAYDEAVRTRDSLELDRTVAETNLSLAQARLSDAQREADRLKDGPDPNDVAALQARVDAAQATLDLQQLKAPFAGTVTNVQVKSGDQISPGEIAFRLDDLSRMLVDVRVSEVDINRIQVGQTANLTFDAILDKTYAGSVTEVSQVGVTTQGVVEFVVTIELTNADQDVKPGMTAAVNIVVDQLENVLLVPNRAVRVLDGQRVVYILQNGELQSVKITLGATSDNMSEVTDGTLRAGDLIVLNPPLVFDSSGGPSFLR